MGIALFSAKNGLETVVFDTVETWLHKAYLFNYFGIKHGDGTAYLDIARAQADEFCPEKAGRTGNGREERHERLYRHVQPGRLYGGVRRTGSGQEARRCQRPGLGIRR